MVLSIARWFCAVLGGSILGAGLVLHGQVAMARYMREEVDHTFFLWRAIGRATFVFQGGDTRMALAMAEVPEQALAESSRAGWVLVIVGGLIAATGPLLGCGRRDRPRRRAS
ncbi:MAG TPA: hypothetical protein VFZ65_21295 [Planctomycetota bacterium]|nr:hypothetical protein [Planctomycetota bacterium]